MRRSLILTLAAVPLVMAPAAHADGVKRTAAGADPAAIQAAVDAFRADIGGNNNGGGGGPQASGRREINWDGVPDNRADPNPFPGGFFNARGLALATPGTGFSVSSNEDPANPPVRFGSNEFKTFTPQRLFRPVGSGVTDNLFFLAGTATQATTNAMGVVFTDVDQAGSAKLEYFDPYGQLIDTVVAPAAPGGLSFAGETFKAGERVARVRITSGTGAIADTATEDAVVMDDFLYGEPQVVLPQPPAPAPNPGPGTPPAAKDTTAPKLALLRLHGAAIRYAVVSDEPGTYKLKLALSAGQAKKLKLKQRTLLTTGNRTLRAGSDTVVLRFSKRLTAKLHKTRIKPLLTVEATDAAGNQASKSQRVAA